MSDKMTYANNADPDQTAPEGAVWSGSTLFVIPLSIFRIYTVCHSTKYFQKQLHKKDNLGQNSME